MTEPIFKQRLSRMACELVRPLVGARAVLWHAPYHANIGDTLIWQGELDLLRKLGVRVEGCDNEWTCRYPELDGDVTILLHGGGNFGTLYPTAGAFRRKVLGRYPHHRVVMMPQSVYYSDDEAGRRELAADVEAFSAHSDAVMCARDRVSYDFMRRHFPANRVLLVPDMAFCIDFSRLEPYCGRASRPGALYIRRLDEEITGAGREAAAGYGDVRDWDDRFHPGFWIGKKLLWLNVRLSYTRFSGSLAAKAAGCLLRAHYNCLMRGVAMRRGCRMIAPYDRVVSTRLHGMILAGMLGKPVEYVDNLTGKLGAFVDTWLSDCPEMFRPYVAP
ncbi:MAG: polysaccharide pyruvyl transferase family protein [Muribaculaceae bacterium]|nr:polysaccharide pyruvyl transferase family protein [Muribaculaceae bacterium]